MEYHRKKESDYINEEAEQQLLIEVPNTFYEFMDIFMFNLQFESGYGMV